MRAHRCGDLACFSYRRAMTRCFDLRVSLLLRVGWRTVMAGRLPCGRVMWLAWLDAVVLGFRVGLWPGMGVDAVSG